VILQEAARTATINSNGNSDINSNDCATAFLGALRDAKTGKGNTASELAAMEVPGTG
jgi:hypothetical protein